MSVKQTSASEGNVEGPHGEETLICQFIHMTNSQGSTWFGGNPFTYTVPLLLAQISLIFFVTSLIWLFLRPCKQGMISAQLIVRATSLPFLPSYHVFYLVILNREASSWEDLAWVKSKLTAI